MTHTVPLREIASARSGDKGNISNISVWPYEERHYEDIRRELTIERIRSEFPSLFRGEIERHELPELCGFNFVMHDGLEGGVASSLNLDAHGKSFSFLFLGLDIELRD